MLVETVITGSDAVFRDGGFEGYLCSDIKRASVIGCVGGEIVYISGIVGGIVMKEGRDCQKRVVTERSNPGKIDKGVRLALSVELKNAALRRPGAINARGGWK